MSSIITIAHPCHQSWQAMTPTEGGRHCAQCAKTVVDFTGWQQPQIQLYIQENSSTGVCGRFRTDQLDLPFEDKALLTSIARSPLPLYQQIAAVILLAFGMLLTGCSDPHTAAPQPTQLTGIVITTPIDTGSHGIVTPHSSASSHKRHNSSYKPKEIIEPEQYRMGGVDIQPYPPVADSVRDSSHIKGEATLVLPDTATHEESRY